MAWEQNQLKIKPILIDSTQEDLLAPDKIEDFEKPDIRRNSQLPIALMNQKTEHVYQREFSCVPNNLDFKAEILKVKHILQTFLIRKILETT